MAQRLKAPGAREYSSVDIFGLSVAYVTMKTRKYGIAIAACASVCVLGYGI